MPLTARLSLSVPPAVKITSDGRAPSFSASVSRDSSIVRRATRPEVCSDDAFPTAGRAGGQCVLVTGPGGVANGFLATLGQVATVPSGQLQLLDVHVRDNR